MVDADERVFEWINGVAGESAALDNAMKLLVSDFFLPVLITLAVFALWFAGKTGAERLAKSMGVLVRHHRAGLLQPDGEHLQRQLR